MSTPEFLKYKIARFQRRQLRHWLIVLLTLVCLWGGWWLLPVPSSHAQAQASSSRDHASIVDRLTKQCFELLHQARYQPLLAVCSEAVNQARAVEDSHGEIYGLINLASAYGALGQYAKAIETAQQSLHLAQAAGDAQGELYGRINLSNAYQSVGQYPQAIEQAEQSLAIAQDLEDRHSEAYALINLASAFWSLGQYAKAAHYSQQSWQLTQQLGDDQGEVCSLINLSSAYGAMHGYPKAINYGQKALNRSQAAGNLRGQVLAHNNLGYVLFRDQQVAEAEAHLRKSIELFESIHTPLLDAQKMALFETLNSPYHTLQRVLVAQGRYSEALEIAERGRARALADSLAQRLYPEDQTFHEPFSMTLAEIRQVARDQQATLVEYALVRNQPQTTAPTADELYIWVVSPAGKVDFRSVELGRRTQSLSQLVKISHPQNSRLVDGNNANSATSDSLSQLYQILIAPIQDLLPTEPSSHVVFVPQGSLFLVPFVALQAPDSTYLIEHHTLRTVPSIQVLHLVQRQRHQRPPTINRSLVVGNPTQDLPAAETEARTIARLLNTSPFLGRKATKTAVVEHMPQADLIHLAAHAAPNLQQDETYGGLIVLADAEDSFSNLTASEILNMRLRAQLVVLSGCSTGVSDIINSDGVVGLARSMLVAGASSVLMSLWPVPDGPTAALMQAFYQHWRPVTPFQGSGLGGLINAVWVGLGFTLLKALCSRVKFHFLIGCFGLALGLVLSLSEPVIPTQTSPDPAQALRQAMLTTLQTHPDPKDWAAFTLMG